MKRFCLCLLLLAATTGLSAEEAPLDLWSGREIVLPGQGNWTLSTGHGRILRAGSGTARFTLPPLTDGATVDAVLIRDHSTRKLRFHSPAPFAGLRAGCADLPETTKQLLLRCGLPENPGEQPEIRFSGVFPPDEENARFTFVFPERRDFPLELGTRWKEISLRTTENPGSLNLVTDSAAPQLDLDGTFTCAILRREARTVAVFSPDFDLEKIENILLIQTLLKEEHLWEKP